MRDTIYFLAILAASFWFMIWLVSSVDLAASNTWTPKQCIHDSLKLKKIEKAMQ